MGPGREAPEESICMNEKTGIRHHDVWFHVVMFPRLILAMSAPCRADTALLHATMLLVRCGSVGMY